MANPNKLVAFFSNFCPHSKSFVEAIGINSLRNEFLLICVDSYANIPPFVDRVPLVYDPRSKRVYVDDELDQLVIQMGKSMGGGDIASYNCEQDGGFCYIDDNGATVCSTQNFMAISDMDAFKINTPLEDNDVKAKKADGTNLETFMAQRDNDIRLMKATSGP